MATFIFCFAQVVKKKKKVKDAQYHFFHRYKHILKDVIFISDLLDREKEESSESEEDENEKPVESAKPRPRTVAIGVISEEEEDDTESEVLVRVWQEKCKPSDDSE